MSEERRRERDRRRDRRYTCGGNVRLWAGESRVPLSGSIINLSMGGCLILLQPANIVALYAIVEASFQSSYLGFRSMGSVRNVDLEHGLIGIAYLDLSLRGRRDLGELFVDLDTLVAASPRLQPTAERRHAVVSGPYLLPL